MGYREMNIRKAIKTAIKENNYSIVKEAYEADAASVLRTLQLHVFGIATQVERWRAIELLGLLARDYAKEDDLAFRNIIRRFIWQMCEEGANVPWASPEVVCSILSQTGNQYDEFIGPVFFHAGMNEINYAGMFWGMIQLGEERLPKFKDKLDAAFFKRLVYPETGIRAYGAWAMQFMPFEDARPYLEDLQEDNSEFPIYENGELHCYRVSDLAKSALEKLNSLE